MRKISLKSRRLATSIAVALAAMSVGSVNAAGLGRLTVQSALGQPLRAEVEVTSLSRDEAQSLSVKLASPDAFKQAGLEYAPALSSLRFDVDRRPDGRATVRISSTQAINEPFVDLLLELNWATGKFVREYTFLLDPPETRVARQTESTASIVAPAAAAPAPATAVDPAALAAAARSAGRARTGATVVAQANTAPTADTSNASNASSGRSGPVEVRPGDTAATIAARVKPANVTMDQAIIAIYRANPSAFFGSVHQLRAGATLNVPEASAMSAIDSNAARAEIRAQMADFNQYKARLAASTRSVETERAGQSAAGSVSGSVTDRSAPATDTDQLKLSKSGVGAGAAGGSVASSDAERQVAAEAAAREAQSRVAELEKNVADLRRLLELKDKQLADLQAAAKASTAKPPAAAAPAAAPTPATPAPTVEPTPAPPAGTVADAPSVATAPVSPPDMRPPATPPVIADTTPTPSTPVVPPPPSAGPGPSAQAPQAKPPVTAPAPEPGLFDDLSENPLMLPGLAALIALVAGSAWIAMRRRKKVEKFEDSLIAPDGFAANSLFGSTGGQTSVDTHNSLFTASRETSSDVHSTEVDPIAEAEVYIAYGREAQAEEILKEALKKQPERQAIRLKLMEIYAGRKDAKLFSAVAADMYEMTGGHNEEWPKVVTLGLSLDPDNPLYSGKGAAIAAAPAAEPDPVTASFDTTTHIDFTPEKPAESAAPVAGPGISAAAAASLAARQGEDKRYDDGSLDFPGVNPEPKAEKEDEVAALDFDLDLDRALNEASADKPASDGSTELSQAIGGRFELPSLDLPSREDSTAREHSGSETALQEEELNIDLPALDDIDAGVARAPEPAAAPAAVDLSAIGLDLQPSTMAPPPNADAARWQEMATKLDLASAYEEIGDNEGARELLQEVLKGGDGDQQQRAQLMLSKIS